MRYFHILSCILAVCMCACEPAAPNDLRDNDTLRLQTTAIVNGQPVTGNDHLNVVALVVYYGGSVSSACTGTLISPTAVLTAGHCVDEVSNPYVEYLAVGIGQKNAQLKVYEIDSILKHPDYYFDSDKVGTTIRNDVAIIKLKDAVVEENVDPVMPMPPELDVTNKEIGSAEGVTLNVVGFGVRNPNNLNSSGEKYETETKMTARCSKSDCNGSKDVLPGFFYTNSKQSGACHGDSGGPAFITRDGVQYIIGVASYVTSMECNADVAYNIVSDYYDFILENVDDLRAEDPEICDNNIDDNGDNRIDCNDPWCFSLPACIPENCKNKKDDNDDGLIDCADPQCFEALACQPEICDDGIDNNDNEYIDCKDPQCSSELICQPEICDDKIDNNGDNKIDCEDSKCAKELVCQPEICDDGIDNNGNEKVDCNDPQCEKTPECLPEICNNGIDDNGDNKVDCNDPKCRNDIVCQPEICNDGQDNNGDNKAGCDDPQCASSVTCQPEICDDGQDNNGNDLIDCADPQCAGFDACSSHGASDDCSAAPKQKTDSGAGLLTLLALLGLGLRRRRVS